jgi:hypothetical protein
MDFNKMASPNLLFEGIERGETGKESNNTKGKADIKYMID